MGGPNCPNCHSYNAQGQPATETVNGRTTAYDYNSKGQLTKVTRPDPDDTGPLAAPETTYSYDSDGNLATSTDPLGNVTTLTYTNGLLNSVTEPDPDGAGPLSAAVTTYTARFQSPGPIQMTAGRSRHR